LHCEDIVALKRSIRWYAVAAVALVAALTATGACFFDSNQQGGTPIHWKGPWSCVLCATFLTFQMDPVVSFLEGCGHSSTSQSCVCVSDSWQQSVLALHGISSRSLLAGRDDRGTSSRLSLFLLQVNRRMLLRLLKVDTRIHSIRWKTEILPFQWRIAVSWASIYITFQLLNPILFAYRGAIEAGKMGMSLSVCSALAGIAVSWMSTKAAPMGCLSRRTRLWSSIRCSAKRSHSLAHFCSLLPSLFSADCGSSRAMRQSTPRESYRFRVLLSLYWQLSSDTLCNAKHITCEPTSESRFFGSGY